MTSQQRFARLAAEDFVAAGRGSRQSRSRQIGQLREVLERRRLLGLLVRRDLQSRYRDSVLGFLWTFIKPLVLLALYVVVLGQILGAARGIPEFGFYVFSGLTIYQLFQETVGGGAGSIVANGGLIKKVYLPREIFPLAATGAAMFMFATQTAVLVVAKLVFGSAFSWEGLAYFIPSILLILVYALASGLLLAALNVYLRDVQYLTELLLMLLMWGSPIVYSWTMAVNAIKNSSLPGWVVDVYTNNPLTLAVLGFHRAFWAVGGPESFPPNLALRMGVAGVIGLVLLLAAHAAFDKMQANLAQEL